ncbi:alpha/beta hydrolase [Roseivivax sp. CAU 1753]
MIHDAGIDLRQHRISSDTLQSDRNFWLQPPLNADPSADAGLTVFLDGEYYLTHFGAPQTMAMLQQEGSLPPMWSAYVSAGDRETRWPESFCSDGFGTFVCDELVPSVRALTGATGQNTLVGVSLTGLSAAHIGLSRPGVFSRVLCHSGSFWWEQGKLAADIPKWPRSDCRFRISIGDEETDTDVDHGHGLIQVQSQLEANRRMRDALLENGFSVGYSEWPGGHTAPGWRRELANDLKALFAQDAAPARAQQPCDGPCRGQGL